MTEAAQHDRAVAAMANELRQLVDTANAPIFGIDVNVSLSFSFSGKDRLGYFSSLGGMWQILPDRSTELE